MEHMVNIQTHLELLGKKVKDKVSGYTGVVCSICFDLYGCVQADIRAGVDEKGEVKQGYWFDVKRLEVLDEKPVMERPDFFFGKQAEGRQGASDKSSRQA